MKATKLISHLRVDNPDRFRLADRDPADSFGLDIEKDEARAMLAGGVKRLADLQERLYAQDRWSVLIILQGIDAAGKDGVVEHVMSGVNPQGCVVHSFKAPTHEELDHDFLWRTTRQLPRRGEMGIFNRSYYEEVLVVRVHPEMLARQQLPPELVTKKIWTQRFKDIRAFERYLARNGTILLKFHLRISKEEQRQRFLARLEEPAKRWKFSMGDVAERKLWDKYMDAYEDMIQYIDAPRALVRGPGRPQMVCAARDRGDHRRQTGEPRPAISEGRRTGVGGDGEGPQRPAGGRSAQREKETCGLAWISPCGKTLARF